jgi:hypothetical protein
MLRCCLEDACSTYRFIHIFIDIDHGQLSDGSINRSLLTIENKINLPITAKLSCLFEHRLTYRFGFSPNKILLLG